MTSPRPPVLLKGAHSAPTMTTLRRSPSARTTTEARSREAGARGFGAPARVPRRNERRAKDDAASRAAGMGAEREAMAWRARGGVGCVGAAGTPAGVVTNAKNKKNGR